MPPPRHELSGRAAGRAGPVASIEQRLAVFGALLALVGCDPGASGKTEESAVPQASDTQRPDEREASVSKPTTIHHPAPREAGGGGGFGSRVKRAALAREAARELEVQLGPDAVLVRSVVPGSFWQGRGGEVIVETTLLHADPDAKATATAICDALVSPTVTNGPVKLVNVQGRGSTPIEPRACDEPRFRDRGLVPRGHPNR